EILMDFFGRPDRIPMMLELLAVARLKPDQQSTVQQDIESSSSMNDFELAIGLEGVATMIEVFDPMLISGLLQTEAYARELIAYHASITLGVNVEASVALRLRRQSALTREASPAELWCVVEEQTLRRPVGDPAVLTGQLDHLLEMTARPNVNVQALPREVGVHPALTGAFYMLRFEDDWRVAYEETRRSAYYYDSPDAVEDYEKVMNHLRHLALNPKRSRALISMLGMEIQCSTTGARRPTAPTTRRAWRPGGPTTWSATATPSRPRFPTTSGPHWCSAGTRPAHSSACSRRRPADPAEQPRHPRPMDLAGGAAYYCALIRPLHAPYPQFPSYQLDRMRPSLHGGCITLDTRGPHWPCAVMSRDSDQDFTGIM
ncbi:MAG: Scr1 family TA system antitoxin-like transcriptional regulator, partial [Sciscionella sp.]